MTERDITIDGPAGALAGTFTTPASAGPHPAALVIGGSGPLDRDGNVKRVALNASRDLARLLDSQGWATLRFDKRGVGASAGEYMPTGLHDELADVRAALAWLLANPDVGPVIAIGHSAGATMAAELAGTDSPLAGAVMLAATAKTGEDTLLWQARQIAGSLPAFARLMLRAMRTDVTTQQRKVLDRVRAGSADVMRIQGTRVNARWMREFMAYDPLPALHRITTPVLALTGAKDVQVDPGDLDTIRRTVATAETHLLTDVDHILRHEPAATSNVQRYKKQARRPMDPQVAERIVDWLARLPVGRGIATAP